MKSRFNIRYGKGIGNVSLVFCLDYWKGYKTVLEFRFLFWFFELEIFNEPQNFVTSDDFL